MCSSDLLGSIDFLTYPHLHFHRSTKSVSLKHVVTSESQSLGGLVSVMINAPVSPRLISIFRKMAQFSSSCQALLHSTYYRSEKIAFMEDVNEIRHEILLLKFTDSEAIRIGARIFMQETLQEFRISDIRSGNMIRKLKGLHTSIVDEGVRRRFVCECLLWGGFLRGGHWIGLGLLRS